ncbi:hypothetical protein Pmani_039064, partial [Petrolisthes manimaculis]
KNELKITENTDAKPIPTLHLPLDSTTSATSPEDEGGGEFGSGGVGGTGGGGGGGGGGGVSGRRRLPCGLRVVSEGEGRVGRGGGRQCKAVSPVAEMFRPVGLLLHSQSVPCFGSYENISHLDVPNKEPKKLLPYVSGVLSRTRSLVIGVGKRTRACT